MLETKFLAGDHIYFVLFLTNITKEHKLHVPYDAQLNEILSGGQKSRLCLATRCYEIEKFGKKIFVLDEPEQGSDPETAISVI